MFSVDPQQDLCLSQTSFEYVCKHGVNGRASLAGLDIPVACEHNLHAAFQAFGSGQLLG